MLEFELHPTKGGLQSLTGGPLDAALDFDSVEAAVRVVGFLSQRDGSVLRIYDATGCVSETQERPATAVMPGAVGGLGGPG